MPIDRPDLAGDPIALTSPVRARVDAFHRRHGGICFADEQHWFYPNGAYRDVNPLGILADPLDNSTPEGEHGNAERIVTFYKLKLHAAAVEFDELDFRLSTSLPTNQERELAELERLHAKVEACKVELAAAEAKLASTAVAKRRAAVREWREEEKRRFEEFQQKRRAIRI